MDDAFVFQNISNLAFMAGNHDSDKAETPMPGGGHLASHEVLESLVW
jgi:hypothetical protein